ncbi:MAG TPA: VOC family protein [Mycobacteriales bacterium]|nr:VOC family protein [Mycobacteriales bacterium]
MTTSSVPGIPCWIDMMSSDTGKSRAFYSQLFGWSAAEAAEEFGGYFMFMFGDVPVAGCMPQMPGENGPDAWTIYLAADDARRAVEVAQAVGSTIVAEPMDIADLGTTAVIIDPSGAPLGIWQANTFPGLINRAEVGAPTWFELHTRAYDTAVGFYRDVFGWDAHTMSDTPDFRYTTLGQAEAASAGIMDASAFPPDADTGWMVYIRVEDTDASVERVLALGGAVVSDPRDTPYGRLAEIADTTGCKTKLMGPNTAS